jgi:hypothetical protein
VLFEDIAPFLFDAVSPEVKLDIFYHFLRFLSLQVNSSWTSSHDFCSDCLLEPVNELNLQAFLSPLWKVSTRHQQASDEFQHVATADAETFQFPLKSWPQSMDTFFGKPHWFQSLCSRSEWKNVKAKYDGVGDFIRNLFDQARKPGRNSDDFTFLHLALENLDNHKK